MHSKSFLEIHSMLDVQRGVNSYCILLSSIAEYYCVHVFVCTDLCRVCVLLCAWVCLHLSVRLFISISLLNILNTMNTDYQFV